jgi:hypothetical protein
MITILMYGINVTMRGLQRYMMRVKNYSIFVDK